MQRALLRAVDHGSPIAVDPGPFGLPHDRNDWGPYAEGFLRMNAGALAALDVCGAVGVDAHGATVRLSPGGRAGAVPLRCGRTGRVIAGLVVEPRFRWAGVGRVLQETGWAAAPDLLGLPMVPGSGREVPPWVLAGPILSRLAALLASLTRGYEVVEEVLRRPRGRILWDRYRHESLARGQWDRLPCRFPDLNTDPRLRRHVRWALERVHQELALVGGRDPVARALDAWALRLVQDLANVTPQKPERQRLGSDLGRTGLLSQAVLLGVEALAWVVDERGLGGGRQQDGLAWQLPLEVLWERWVEALVRREAAATGAEVRVGRLGETVFPLAWTTPSLRSLGSLVPDIVVRRGRTVRIVDAKYKAHLVEVDEEGWRRMAEGLRDAHRADLHQVLAYASLYEADEVTATLAYPVRLETWETLQQGGRDVARAELFHGGRLVRVELRGLPFGGMEKVEPRDVA